MGIGQQSRGLEQFRRIKLSNVKFSPKKQNKMKRNTNMKKIEENEGKYKNSP